MPNSTSDTSVVDDDVAMLAAVRSVTDMPDVRDSDTSRFIYAVKKGVENRAYTKWQCETGSNDNCAIFVYVPRPRQPSRAFRNGAIKLRSVRDLPIANQKIFGRIFFLGLDASNGTYMDLPVPPDDIEDWLETVELASAPIATAYKSTLKMSFYSKSNETPPRYFTIRDKQPQLKYEDLKDALKNFYENNLLTPTMCSTTVWEPGLGGNYIPGPQAEREIQKSMRTSLQSWFHGLVTVDLEDVSPIGRIDVKLLFNSENSQAGKVYWSIIELKVIKCFSNTKVWSDRKPWRDSTNVETIVEGFSQADNFSQVREVPEGFLEIFDLRKDKVNLLTDPKVVQAVKQCKAKVNFNVRELYGSSKDARKAGYSDVPKDIAV